MGVNTITYVKFYTKDKKLVEKYNLDDRSDDYIYEGLVANGGAKFNPSTFGEFSDEQKEIMKLYFDKDSMSVSEGYAKVVSNIQSPDKLLPIWNKIRGSIIVPFQTDLKEYHNSIISDYKKVNDAFEKSKNTKKGFFFKKEDLIAPELTQLKSEYEFEDLLWCTIWKIDSISKVIGLLIAAKQNNMLVEITAADY